MSKKITEEQLTKMKELIGLGNKFQSDLGGIAIQKHKTLNLVVQLDAELDAFKKDLEAEYGAVSIDLTTGEITEEETELKVEETELVK
jgi:hypothetical protein